MTINIFEKASRLKLTFATKRGHLSVEQLWDLPLKGTDVSLNSLAVGLKKTLSKDEDFVDLVDGDSTNTAATVQRSHDKLRFDILLHIISVLKAERDEKVLAESRASQLRAIDEAIAARQQQDLVTGSVEDLLKKRAEILNGSAPTL